MFANTQAMGIDFAFPDVCLTPAPPSPSPVPAPYPNIATSQMAVGAVYNVLFVGAPAHNLSTSIPLTNGDNLGVGRGVVSGKVMGSARHTSGATTVAPHQWRNHGAHRWRPGHPVDQHHHPERYQCARFAHRTEPNEGLGAGTVKEDAMQLATIDPDTLARDAVEAVLVQLERSATHLFPAGRAAQLRAVSERERQTRRWREQALSSELGRAVAGLVRFAQSGTAQNGALALETPIVEAALRSAITDDAFDFDDEHLAGAVRSQGDLAALLVNVVLAARTRVHLEMGEAVSVPGLAALVGVDMREVRGALRLGATQSWVPAAVARAWLASRPDLP